MSEQLLNQILEKLISMEKELTEVKGTMAAKADLKEIKADIANLEGQMIETNQIIKGIRHNTEFISAEVNGLKATTANLEAVKRTEKMIAIMNAKITTKDDLAEFRTHLIDEMDAVRAELKDNITQVESNIRNDMKSLYEITGEHEVKIRNLSRRSV